MAILANIAKRLCFNPRTREGATDVVDFDMDKLRVSIHAPVRVRPHSLISFKRASSVSIHAPVRVRLAMLF